jgi:hypothetical protein|tara:strand:+ start:6837 stop:7505 length:669 start_codon:yes stop_codon:yes gene_type:complete
MKFDKYSFITIIVISLFLLNGCATTYTIHLIDEEDQKSPSGIPIKILDENGRDELISDESNAEGQFKIDLKEIPGDSFKIAINDNDYFEISEWITTPGKSAEKKYILEKRVTIITGWVFDEKTIIGIPNCKITTSPTTTSTYTNPAGKFVLKSNGFAEGLPYTIFASKPPTYNEMSTSITPNIKKKNNLDMPIYLNLIVKDDLESVGDENTRIIPGVDIIVN